MELKQQYELPKPTGSYEVGCMNILYEYEVDGTKRQLPCLCYYPAKDMANEQPRSYVDERVLLNASGITTHTYVAKNQTTTAMVDGKEVELSVLGAAESMAVEDIINTLLLDFFGKYLKEKGSQALDTQNTLQGISVIKKPL